MLTKIPDTLSDLISHAEGRAKIHNIPVDESLEAVSVALGAPSFAEIRKVYEGAPDAGAFLQDIGSDEFFSVILVPRRVYVPEEDIRIGTSGRVDRAEGDGVLISFMSPHFPSNLKFSYLGLPVTCYISAC